MVLHLGNHDAIEPQAGTSVGDDSNSEAKSIEGEQVTTLVLDDTLPVGELLTTVSAVWRLHSTGEPQWVDGDDSFIVEAVSRSFDCPVGQPKKKTKGS